MQCAIIKYNAGNVMSVSFALNRLGIEPIISDDPEIISSADKVIFPGVGEASTAMNYLRAKGIDKLLIGLKQPVIGICLGLQLLCKYSEENNTECLGIFDETVKLFPPTQKVPHMGWNTINNFKSKLFDNVEVESYGYFVHSYYAEIGINTIAQSNYILPFSAGLSKNNFYACQFHPEKSGEIGSKILENFITKIF